MIAHSAVACQCNSRTPPGVRRMLTPAIAVDVGNSLTVTWRAQSPGWILRCCAENVLQKFGGLPWSVGGGTSASGCTDVIGLLSGPGLLASLPCWACRTC